MSFTGGYVYIDCPINNNNDSMSSPGAGCLRLATGYNASMKHIVLWLVLSCFLGACTEELSSARPYILTTATTGGAFYPIGVAIGTITKSQLQSDTGIYLSAISSAGSQENIKLLRDNQAQFGIIQGIFAAWAWSGEGPVNDPQEHLRSVSALWVNVEHFVLHNDLVRGGTLSDIGTLDGERFVLGARNSGAEQTGRYILEALDIDYEERLDLAWMGYGGTANAIQDGNIVGMNVPAGAPVSAITQAFAQMGEDLTILDVTDEELAAINQRYDLWSRYDLPPETYPNQTETVHSIAHPNVLATRRDVPEEVVYHVNRVIWENLASLQDIHGATDDMALERALDGLGAPLHPGAIRYFRERGLDIPERLILEGEDRPAGLSGLDTSNSAEDD